MPSCSSAPRVLLLVTVTLCSVCESAHPVVKVEFNGTAVLPCSERCSGVARWTLFSKSSDILAECDQISCRSVKEGYQMIHNQYLQGDLSLIITEADFSKRALYTCDCDNTDLNDVQLQIETLNSTLYINPGESLRLDLHISDPVEVIYSSSGAAGASSVQICRVERHTVQMSRNYSERASVSSVLELRGVKESDSGVYSVRDTFNEEIIHIYTVIVHGVSGDSGARGQEQKPTDPNSPPSPGQGAALYGAFMVLGVVLGVVCVVLVVVNVVQWRRIQRLQKKSTSKRDSYNHCVPVSEQCDNICPGEEDKCLQK